jgi:hypothetical protein
MKTVYERPDKVQANNQNPNNPIAAWDKDDYNNEMGAGTVGAEGSIYNGASELRYLRKKYGSIKPKDTNSSSGN